MTTFTDREVETIRRWQREQAADAQRRRIEEAHARAREILEAAKPAEKAEPAEQAEQAQPAPAKEKR
jgi:hypothetical protein